jgi:methylenetetrahydrofolate dehydrogenase (NADP+)/methenyltetrahydrofolate cyclohydrolase
MYEEKKIPGKEIAERINKATKAKVGKLVTKPKLAIVLASHDESSEIYVKLKTKIANQLGIQVESHNYDESITKTELINYIQNLNSDESINGILLQLPLYHHLSEDTREIVNSITKQKDVDGLTAAQQGDVNQLIPGSFPTAAVEATIESLNYCFEEDLSWENISKNPEKLKSLQGLDVLIVNNTNLVGKPLSQIMSSLGATVTIANVYTKNLKEISRKSDIVISATNQTNLFDHNDIKENSILIDITSVSVDGKIIGDFIQSEELLQKCKFITPVPRGVGPLTIACLLRNLTK